MGNGNLLQDVKRTQKISTHIWGKEEPPRKNIHAYIWTTLPGLTEKLLRNNQAHLFPIKKIQIWREIETGEHAQRFHYQKICTFKGTHWKSKVVCLPTFLLKSILLETPRNTQIKYPPHWLVFPALEMLRVVFQNIFIHLTDALVPRFLASSTSRLPQGHSTSARVFIGIPWGSHHLMHWDGVSLLFVSGAKWDRCHFIPLRKQRQILKTRIFLPEQDPCSETHVTGRNVAEFWGQTGG